MPAAVAVADQTLAQHFYMPNRPLAPVERAQAAINNIATRSHPISQTLLHPVQNQLLRASSAINPAGSIVEEGLEKRQPNGNQSDVESQKEERT